MEFEFDIKLPSLNEYLQKARRSPHAENDMKQSIQNDLMILMYQQIQEKGYKIPFKTQVDVHFIFTEKDTKRDKDNISATGKKFILDALVQRGVLIDDGWDYIGDYSEKFLLGKKHNVRVLLTERQGKNDG